MPNKEREVYVVQHYCGPALGSVEGVYTRERLAQAKKEELQRRGEDCILSKYKLNPTEED